MNKLTLLLLLLFLASCGNAPEQQTAPEENTEPDSVDLLGAIQRSDLQKAPFNEWYNSGYQSYQPDSTTLATTDLSGTEIITFMGTWCSDSQREVPHFFKMLDDANYPADKMKMIAVDEDKAEPADDISKWGIEYVPTIILLKDGEEIGRIIETPGETLEKDMAAMIGG